MANRQGVGVELRRHSELPRLGKRPTPMPPRPSKMDVCTCTVRTSKVRWRQAACPPPAEKSGLSYLNCRPWPPPGRRNRLPAPTCIAALQTLGMRESAPGNPAGWLDPAHIPRRPLCTVPRFASSAQHPAGT